MRLEIDNFPSFAQQGIESVMEFPKPFPLSPNTRFEYKQGAYWGTKPDGRRYLSKGVSESESLYYWWVQFLKLSWKYQHACGLSVEMTPKMEKEYAEWWERDGEKIHGDFGDIFTPTFWKWYSTGKRGANLFGYYSRSKPTAYKSWKTAREIKHLVDDKEYLLLALPTSMTKTSLKKQLSTLIDDLEREGTLNGSNNEPKPEYPPYNDRISVSKLESYHYAYQLKQEGQSNIVIGAHLMELGEKELENLREDARKHRKKYKNYGRSADRGSELATNYATLYQDRLMRKLGDERSQALLESLEASDSELRNSQKNALSVKASRYLAKAKANIIAAEVGDFPA
jgi:hypothetical protein